MRPPHVCSVDCNSLQITQATLLYDGKQLRIFAVDEEGHLCMGRVSFLAALPLAPVAPIMDDRTMTELHVVGDVPPAAVLYNGKGAPPLSDLRAATFGWCRVDRGSVPLRRSSSL